MSSAESSGDSFSNRLADARCHPQISPTRLENKAVTCAKWDILFRLPPTGDIIEPALTMWQRLFKDPRRPSTGSM